MMRIAMKTWVNILWTITATLWICLMVTFVTGPEIISAIVGLVFIGSLCLFQTVRRSEPGQQVFQTCYHCCLRTDFCDGPSY